MDKSLIIPKQVVTVNPSGDILKNAAVEVFENKINNIIKLSDIDVESYDGVVLYYPTYTLIPGLIQTHTHLCQTLFKGLADDLLLLDWLKNKIFPFENAHSKNSLRLSAKLGIHELQTSGTTTILDMGTINHQEVIFEELINSGMRAFAGKCMMDSNNLFPEFKETTQNALSSSYELAKEFHNTNNGRIKYGFAPRFVLSCSEKLLKEAAAMVKDFAGSIYHTHSSENKSEIEEVRKRFSKGNIEYFDSLNVLDNNTVLAHCIHVSEEEIKILKRNNVGVAHCPSSNLKLGSGIANIPEYLKEGIKVSIGADGAPCNNNLSAFIEMRLAALIQKPIHGPSSMDAKTVFKLATIDGAKALNLEKEIGSIEIGKKADLVLMDLESPHSSMSGNEDSIYSDLVYANAENNVKEVMIDGEWVVKGGESINYLSDELCFDGKYELEKLLKRI